MNPVHPVPIQNGAMQQPGYVLAPAPTQAVTNAETRPGYKARLVTGVIQALLGVTLVLCGVVVLVIRYPEQDYFPGRSSGSLRHDYDEGDELDRDDRRSWAIWMGIVAVIISVFGFLSKRNQALISVYMVCSIIGCLVALVGIIVATGNISRTVNFRYELRRRTGEINSFYEPCQVRFSYDANPTHDPSLEEDFVECIDAHIRTASAHLPFYCIMLICFVVWFVVSIIGASSTCAGLDCCSSSASGRPGQQFVYLQPAPVQMPPPQVITVEPPPPYTSLNFNQPPTCQPLQASPLPRAPANPRARQAPASGAGDAYLRPDVSRRLQSSTLPRTSQQQHQSDDSEYLELEGDNPAYVEPDDGGNATYLEPNTGGRALQTDSAYLEPDARGGSQRSNAYIQPNAAARPRGDQNETYTYEYADPREEQLARNTQATRPFGDTYTDRIYIT